jgi:hypothetical protein
LTCPDGIFGTYRVDDTEAVHVDVVRIDVVRMPVPLQDEAEPGTQRRLAEFQWVEWERIRLHVLAGANRTLAVPVRPFEFER